MSFLGEIKRRKVFQVAAVYAVVAWLIIQIVDVVGEPLTLPSWIDAVVIVLLAVGFPIAVILAWAFDLTPQGIKADSEIQGSSLSAQLGGQRLNYLLQGLVLVAVGFLVVDQYVLEPRVSSIAISSVPTGAGSLHVNRFDYDLPEGQSFRNSGRSVIAFSPGGRHFVYNTGEGLYLRAMGELEAQLIPGTEPNSTTPIFSPDGQAVAYWEHPQQYSRGGRPPPLLKRINISGSAPVVIADVAENPSGMSWEADGTILIGQPEGILRVSATGGAPQLIIPSQDGELLYGPQSLPDGDFVLFSATTGDWDAAQIVAQSPSSGERTVLVEGGSDARYLPTGHLVYAVEDGLFAVAFDPNSLTVTGGAVSLVQGVMRRPTGRTGAAQYGVSEDGALVYVTGNVRAAARTLVWVDREGREAPLSARPRSYVYARISPDGTKVALDVRDQEFDIWTWDLTRETLTRLTLDPRQDQSPLWSPDSRRVAFMSGGQSMNTLFWQAADGTGPPEPLAESSGQIRPNSFLPDGTGLLVTTSDVDGNDDIAILRLEGEDRATPLLQTLFGESNADVSPDGRWLAYASNESGSEEIYVRPFPDVDAGRSQVSGGGGTQPLWARDGEELFYRNGEAVIAVPIQTDSSFTAGNPEVMFEGQYFVGPGGRSYDVSPDGARFLMIREVEGASTTSQIIVVENWFTELERLVPRE